MSRRARCRGRSSKRLDVGSLRGLGMGFKLTAWQMMGTHVIFTSATNLWIKIEMHARLLHMFSNLNTQGHWYNMDNLFNSVNLA